MVELGQIRPLKRMRFADDYEDRISKLPDSLISEILSRLPDTKYAIRTGTLSKRWKRIWTTLPNLAFLQPRYHSNAPFSSSVNKTLTLRRHLKLNKFTLDIRYTRRLLTRIHNWIRYVVNCNVEVLNLTLQGPDDELDFPLDQFVFTNSCFNNLSLAGCAIIPTGAISWEKLRVLSLSYANLGEDLIENILLGSPVLETLVLNYCYGYMRLDIASTSVKKLAIVGYLDPYRLDFKDNIEINAPNIVSLTVKDCLLLSGKLLLMNVSSLVKVDLDYTKPMGSPEDGEEEMLKRFILNLVHVKDINIGISCLRALGRLKDEGFLSPSNLKLQGQVDAITSSG